MKCLWRLIVVALSALPLCLPAQLATSVFDSTYGLDPLLVNGKFYAPDVPPGSTGSPYFSGPEFVHGDVTMRGIHYPDLLLKYDLYQQQVVLQYRTPSGSLNNIALSWAWLEAFDLGKAHFILLSVPDSTKQIYQVIGSGPLRVLYFWSKKKTYPQGAKAYAFSKAKKDAFVWMGTQLQRYKNNRNFIQLFDAAHASLIKSYLAREHVRVKNASDTEMTALVKYYNTQVSR